MVLYEIDSMDLTISNYKIAEKLILQSKDSSNLGLVTINLGDAYMKNGQHEKAEEYFAKSIRLGQILGNEEGIFYGVINLAEISRKQKNHFLADEYLNLIDTLLAENDLAYLKPLYLGEKAQSLFDQNQIDKSLELANQAYHLEKTLGINDNANRLFLYRLLTEIYEKKKEFSKAYEFQSLHTNLSEQITSQTNESGLRSLQSELKNRTVLSQKLLEEHKLVRKTERSKWYKVLAIVLGLSILGYIILLSKYQKQKLSALQADKKLISQDLLQKQKEMTDKALIIAHSNESVKDSISDLLHLKKELPQKNQHKLQLTIQKLQQLNKPESWSDFERSFTDINTEFYKTLQQKFPDLTMGERKLCALLKMEMTTKEISALMFKSQGSIEVARSRLRKKLGINNSKENLVNFLMNLN